MKFEVDSQTICDLDIFDSAKNKQSVFNIFNCAQSHGGKETLMKLLSKPTANIDIIKERLDIIRFFQKNNIEIKLDKQSLDFIEYYLLQGNYPTQPDSYFRGLEKAFFYKIKPKKEYYIIERGIDYVIEWINILYNFYTSLSVFELPEVLKKQVDYFHSSFTKDFFDRVLKIKNLRKLKVSEIVYFDYIIRYSHREKIRNLLDMTYSYDVYLTVVSVAVKKGLVLPEILPAEKAILSADSLFHPFLSNPVPNNITFREEKNLLFITGPNMAGKSTLMKSLGIAVYLAHIGFPVPAQKMQLSILSGLSTTINLNDNIIQGESHFYSEVKRIKHVAELLKSRKRILVIFDELFRGTNIKDASEGSLAIISAFSEVRKSFFAISTHIVEISNKLADKYNINFQCFEIDNSQETPRYTYQLKDGISEDRLGMYIIKKENIINIIKSINET